MFKQYRIQRPGGGGGEGARNMKSLWLTLAAIFFMTYFHRVGAMPPSAPPRSATVECRCTCLVLQVGYKFTRISVKRAESMQCMSAVLTTISNCWRQQLTVSFTTIVVLFYLMRGVQPVTSWFNDKIITAVRPLIRALVFIWGIANDANSSVLHWVGRNIWLWSMLIRVRTILIVSINRYEWLCY